MEQSTYRAVKFIASISGITNSITEAELHREFFFTILKAGQIAVLPHNRLIAESQRQMRSGDYQHGSNHVLATLLNPRFNGNRERGHCWKECEVFEKGECKRSEEHTSEL